MEDTFALDKMLAEAQHAESVFSTQQVAKTIVFFGSSLLGSGESSAWKAPRAKAPPAGMTRFYPEAQQLAHQLATWAAQHYPDPTQRPVICTGGGPGIMEAANRGAAEAGQPTAALKIHIPYEVDPNLYITPELCIPFHSFAMRKHWFFKPMAAIVVFPGGIGTLDELFEFIVLQKTGKLNRTVPAILYGRDFWQKAIDFDHLIESGVIEADVPEMFELCDTPEEAFSHLTAQLESDG